MTILKHTSCLLWALLIVLCPFLLSAQTYDHLMTDLFDVTFADASTAYACGDNGVVLKSEDEGQNWQIIHLGNHTYDLRALDFIDSERGWMVAANGLIFVTQNGGFYWSIQYKSENDNTVMNDIKMSKTGVGFAVGASGTALRTDDYGKTWSDIPFNFTDDYTRIEITIDDHVFFAGKNSIARSTDGGLSWQTIDVDTGDESVSWTASSSDAEGRILLAGKASEEFVMVSSTDQGATWERLPAAVEAAGLAIIGDQILAVDRGNRINISDDFGVNWERSAIDGPEIVLHTPHLNAHGLANSGQILLYCTQHHGIMRSVDGGRSWTTLSYVSSNFFEEGHYYGNGEVLAVGFGGKFLRSLNHGATWVADPRGAEFDSLSLSELYVIDADVTLALCNRSMIARYEGPQGTWKKVNGVESEDIAFKSLAFNEAGMGLAVGLDRSDKSITAPGVWVTAETRNEGKSWNGGPVRRMVANFLPAHIAALGNGRWIVVGVEGRVGFSIGTDMMAISTDDGATWEYVQQDLTQQLTDIERVPNGSVFFSGWSGVLRRSDDNGLTWSTIETGTNRRLYDVTFFDNNSGFVGGSAASILTRDGGSTWSIVEGAQAHQFRDAQFYSQNEVYAFSVGAGPIRINLDRTTSVANSTKRSSPGSEIVIRSLAPIPANSTVSATIELASPANQSRADISLFNYMGRKVADLGSVFKDSGGVANAIDGEFNVSHLPSGVYFLTVVAGNLKTSAPFVVRQD